MKKQFNTVSYLYSHWGIGFALAGLYVHDLTVVFIGLISHTIAQIINALTK